MKKILVILSVLILISAVFTACDKKQNAQDEEKNTSADIIDNYSLTEPSYTVGAVATSEKYDTGEGEYQIRYYDADGIPARCDYYRDNKLAYYSIFSGTDDMGNAIQEKYYNAEGKFVAIYDNGVFFDESGNRLSETYVLEILG